MFKIGQMVVYGIHGVCTVTEMENRVVDKKQVDYYVLEPIDQTGTRFLVPAQNQAALSKVRRILTRKELDQLLSDDAVMDDVWISDENRRKQRYRELISSADRLALLAMVRTLHRRKREQIAAGRKFHICDENFLRDAQKLLDTEFSIVLNMSPQEISAYMQKLIG